MSPPPTFPVRLVGARMLSPTVRELSFERDDGDRTPFAFQAGQWMSLVLPLAEGQARRAYSIASAPNERAGFDLAVTLVQGGAGSTYLHALTLGSTLQAVGPQGFFTRTPGAGHPSLFVGTGTGVTPLRSMIKAALAHGEASPMTLLFGVRHEEEQLYREELEELDRLHGHFRVLYSISQPREPWTGLRGYVQGHVEACWRDLETSGAGTPPHVYICGLEKMVSAVRDKLRKEMGVDRKQVHSERYD